MSLIESGIVSFCQFLVNSQSKIHSGHAGGILFETKNVAEISLGDYLRKGEKNARLK